MDNKAFKQGMAVLVKIFPDKEIDPDVMYVYLKDLKNEDFLKAIDRVVMTTKDINKATNLIALIRDYAIPEDLSAGEAFSEVLKAISEIGSYNPQPKFSNESIDRAVSSIGWRNLCMSENISVERAHFLKIYDSISQRERSSVLSLSNGCLPKKDVDKLINTITNSTGVLQVKNLTATVGKTI